MYKTEIFTRVTGNRGVDTLRIVDRAILVIVLLHAHLTMDYDFNIKWIFI